MVRFEEAYQMVMDSVREIRTERIPLHGSLHRILAEKVVSDVNMPPFHKSAVDGYACRREDLGTDLEMVEMIPAGSVPKKLISAGQCAMIMTGAMVPEGADTIIMVEDVIRTPSGSIRFTKQHSAANICYLAEDVRAGEDVLFPGTLIRPQEMAVMAAVGYTSPLVYRKISVGIISTGDELVEPDQVPAASQIRNSNAIQLTAQISRMGLQGNYFGIARDNKDSIRSILLEANAACDVIILSGGVSMGVYDYVPEVLSELKVNILFDSIAIQPGRPTLFGLLGGHYVFGLPGNPVSSFVLFELLIRPFLYKLQGHEQKSEVFRLPMGLSYSRKRSQRKSLIPVTIRDGKVFPVDYHGSAHIHAYVHADGIMVLEARTTDINEGELVDVRPI